MIAVATSTKHPRPGSIGTAQICAESGLSLRQIHYAVRVGLLSPPIALHGSGQRNEYSEDDRLMCILVKQLIDDGFEMRNAWHRAHSIVLSEPCR